MRSFTTEELNQARVQLCQDYMSDQQRQDMSALMTNADDMAAAATTLVTCGAMGYTAFIQARDFFREQVIVMMQHYRVVLHPYDGAEG